MLGVGDRRLVSLFLLVLWLTAATPFLLSERRLTKDKTRRSILSFVLLGRARANYLIARPNRTEKENARLMLGLVSMSWASKKNLSSVTLSGRRRAFSFIGGQTRTGKERTRVTQIPRIKDQAIQKRIVRLTA